VQFGILLIMSDNRQADTQDDDEDDEEDEPLETTTPPPSHATPVTSSAAPVAPAPAPAPAPAAASIETTAAAVAPTTSSNQPTTEQMDQLRQMLANIQPNTSAPIALSDVLTSQSLTPLLNDPEICASLFPFLPEESERSAAEVRAVVRSPQFSQALQSLSAALATGQLGPLLSQLGLDPSAGNSVESFLIAIGEQAKHKKEREDAMEED
jgi:26S proteasome regulatory subunit N13